MIGRIRLANSGAFALLCCGAAWAYLVVHAQTHASHVMSAEIELVHWIAMVIAMMFPLLREPIRRVQFRSFPERRASATLLFLGGYLAVWAMAGLPVVWLRGQSWAQHPAAAAIAFAVTAAWTLSRWHTVGMRACHATRPLSPYGWRARGDVMAYGARIGGACLTTCWPLMVACTLTGHAMVAMVACLAVGMIDRLAPRPAPGRVAKLELALAVGFACVAVISGSQPAVSAHCMH